MAGAISALFLVSILAFGLDASFSAEKIRFATSFKGPHFDLLVLAAEEKGFFKHEGLEAQWFSMEGGSPTIQALAAGSVDSGVSTPTTMIQGAARGVATVMVADLGLTEDWRLWVKADGPVKQPGDLKGSKVGTSRFGGQAYANARVLLKGLGLEKDVRLVAAGGLAHRVAALKTGAIDAFALGEIAATSLKVRGEIRGLGSLRAYLPKEWSDMILFAHKEVGAKTPEGVKKTIKAILMAADSIQSDSRWSLEKLKSFSRYTEAEAKEVLPLLRYGKGGRIDKKTIENVRDFLIEYNIVKKEATPVAEELFTNRYLP